MSVDLPSSTEPQVLKRRISMGCCDGGIRLKISGLLPVFHCGFTGFVIGAGAALRHARSGDFIDDVLDAVSPRFNHSCADHVGNGADADDHFLDGFVRFGAAAVEWIGLAVDSMRRRDRQPLSTPPKTVPLVAEVNDRNVKLLTADILPDIHFGPVREREHAHVLAWIQTRVVEVPDFRTLILRIPLAEAVAKAEKPFLGAGFLFITPRAADAAIKPVFLN